MALKFLNKKGWHTGSLRNVENVWKAEQKHDAEQKKLEELRKQIQEERERTEFRLLQEQAGLVPRQDRLDFLYESGLAVGKGSSSGFKDLQAPPQASSSSSTAVAAEASGSKAAVPGALFEDKPHSANDSWRKLHSDPLLLIRQRQQEALAQIKNNPVQMAMIKKSVEAEKKHKEEKKAKREKKKKGSHSHSDEEKQRRKDRSSEHRHSKESRHGKKLHLGSVSDYETDGRERRTTGKHSRTYHEEENNHSDTEEDASRDVEKLGRKGRPSSEHRHVKESKHDQNLHLGCLSNLEKDSARVEEKPYPGRVSDCEINRHKEKRSGEHRMESRVSNCESNWFNELGKDQRLSRNGSNGQGHSRHRRTAPKLSEEEREALLRSMRVDAEVHEEQRWKRLKKASESDAREAARAAASASDSCKNFLEAAQKSIFGTEKGGSSTIEESVRRRAYYSQGGALQTESHAFRR